MTASDRARRKVVALLLQRHGTTFSEELDINLARNTPAPLFRWLCASLLLSARISSGIAMRAARALSARGWTTPQKMAASTWRQRVRVLDASGYARYDERTSRMLGDAARLLIDEYGGDLRKLRVAADCQPDGERKRLRAFAGMGEVGVDIFFREVQQGWKELYPFADRKALAASEQLGLGNTADGLAGLVGRSQLVRVVAALVRAGLNKDIDEIRRLAGESNPRRGE